MPVPPGAPTLADVEAIIALDDQPVLRNLRITQCYHDLSQAVAVLTGAENINWCSFATWASKSAGRFIRNDEVPALLRDALAESQRYSEALERLNRRLASINPPVRFTEPLIIQQLEKTLLDLSGNITTGNLKVFSELGPLYAAMVQSVADPAPLLERLRPGPAQSGGQDLLRSAVTEYHRAILESDGDCRAERILLANAQVGLHEQIRLQPYIAGGLEAPIRDGLVGFVHREFDTKFSGRLLEMIRPVLDSLLHPVVEAVNELWLESATRWLMELRLPDGVLRLGCDLPAPPGKPLFPPALARIDYQPLRELLEQYGAAGQTARASGVSDWASLPERMGYILELFRSRQQDPALLQQPFGAEQREAIARGTVPGGEL